jgi:hypothetical protein
MLVRTLTILALACSAAHAGTTLETVNRDLADGRATTINTWAQNGMMRVETQPTESTMVFKDDTIYVINHQDKSYFVMDRASMKRMADQVNPMLKMLQERMKDMTPEQRAQMEKMMGGSVPGMGGAEKKQEIKRTARADKIGGHSCTYVEVLEDGVLTDEMCIVPGTALKGSDELLASAKKMANLMKEMMSGMDAPWLQQMAQKQMHNFESLGGIPVLSRHFDAGKPRSETTLTSIRSESLGAATFEVPAGYTKKDMMTPR